MQRSAEALLGMLFVWGCTPREPREVGSLPEPSAVRDDYDPFARGHFPVGVTTFVLSRDRLLPVEVWYPAADAHEGQDLDDARRDRFTALSFADFSERTIVQDAVRDATPRDGRFPLVVYTHGSVSSRRDATFLMTHLASRGYVIVAADHTGNTTEDLKATAEGKELEPVDTTRANRIADICFVLDRVAEGAAGIGDVIDMDRVGIIGTSFGGWAALMMPQEDARFSAVVANAPGVVGPEGPLGEAARRNRETLELNAWRRPAHTLLFVAERDIFVPLVGVRAFFNDLPPAKRYVVLKNTGHTYFGDSAAERHTQLREMLAKNPMIAKQGIDVQPLLAAMGEPGELLAEALAEAAIYAVILAHLDASLKGSEDAAAFLDRDLEATMAARGISVALE